MPDSDAGVADDLPVAIRYYRCGESIEGGIGCNDPMRNFVCYADEQTSDEGNVNLCRLQKFYTKPVASWLERSQIEGGPSRTFPYYCSG